MTRDPDTSTLVTVTLQRKLRATGDYHGAIDGIEGPLTRAAAADYKRGHGLRARPFVGPITWAMLAEVRDADDDAQDDADATMPRPSATPWLDYGLTFLGETEITGPDHNPVIVEWGRRAGIDWWNNDEDAWCAVAVNGWLVAAGYPSTESALARSFSDYGTRLSQPVRGAIVVFPRGSIAWQGHVGIVETVHGDGTITILNGNVGDAVRLSKRRVSDIIPDGVRWPPGAPMP